MKLCELLRGLTVPAQIPSQEIRELTESSAKAAPDTLFFCIRGARADGHAFAPDAYARGCRAFVAERPLSLPSDALVVLVPDSRQLLGELACRHYGHPSRKMHLIGITGTKGKTTVAHLIAHLLNTAGIPCGYIGTNGIAYGNVKQSTRNTTPDAVTLQKALSEMYATGVKTAVIEVSSQALMQHRVAGMHFETVLFTNLSPDHIGENEHRDFAHYKACKKQLFDDFGATCAVYNADDPAAEELLCNTTAKELVSCSLRSKEADFFADRISLIRNEAMLGIGFWVSSKKEACYGRLPLPGTFNAENALLAIATVTHLFGLSLSAAMCAMETVLIAGRCEVIPLPNSAAVVIDYAHNGVSLEHLLSTLRGYQPKRLIALFGSVGERTKLRRAEMGRVAHALCDLCILTSDNPGREDPEAIIEEIAAAFADGKTPYRSFPDRAKAIRAATAMTTPGDLLVLAGKGHENYQLIGTEKIPFCERELVNALAKEMILLN